MKKAKKIILQKSSLANDAETLIDSEIANYQDKYRTTSRNGGCIRQGTDTVQVISPRKETESPSFLYSSAKEGTRKAVEKWDESASKYHGGGFLVQYD
jgi:hypothetical protein